MLHPGQNILRTLLLAIPAQFDRALRFERNRSSLYLQQYQLAIDPGSEVKLGEPSGKGEEYADDETHDSATEVVEPAIDEDD